MEKILSGSPMLARSAEHFTRIQKMNGFPVHWRNVSTSGATESEHLLTSAQAQSLSADTFSVPQGFTEKSLAGGD